MMKKELFPKEERGSADYGWLTTNYSFSFAEWFDPSRMGFGKLRVINDDIIAPLGKFGMHSHADFEIITIPLEGSVTHEDNMGNKGAVHAGEVQAMSAGRGVTHSEYNASDTEVLSLFQIWIEPNVRGAEPRYAQATFDQEGRKNAWQVLVSDGSIPNTLPIYQNARIVRGDLDASTSLSYDVAYEGNGLYLMVIDGEVEVQGELLGKRDAIGISETDTVSIKATKDASLLLIDVPLV